MRLGWQLSPDGLGLEIDLTHYEPRGRGLFIDRITIPLSVFQKECSCATEPTRMVATENKDTTEPNE